MFSSRSNHQGFTLIELSIVLVIIGLLVGSIFIGRDLIFLAQLRSQISQIENLNNALYTFNNKYKCLPGDCDRAVEVGLGTPGGPGDDGDGNGTVDYWIQNSGGTNYARLYSQELENFWAHLSRSNLIAGQYTGYTGPPGSYPIPGVHSPALKLRGTGRDISFATTDFNTAGGVWLMSLKGYMVGGVPPVQYLTSISDFILNGHAWLLTTNTRQNATSGVYTAPIIYSIEMKLDDGFPQEGRIRVFDSTVYTAPDMMESMLPGQTCQDTSVDPWVYRYSNNTVTTTSICNVVIATPF